MADPLSPDWWLDRLYKRLRTRHPLIKEWDAWYSGDHPAPLGYEKAQRLMLRLLDTTGLNILAPLTDAALERMAVEGFKVGGAISDDLWAIWQSNNMDLGYGMVNQEKMALSEGYMLVDPNENAYGDPTITPEHPEQCIVEVDASSRRRAAGLKVYVEETADGPIRFAYLNLPDRIEVYAAPTRMSGWALKPQWEYQESLSGENTLGEVSLIPFSNRARLLQDPRPEFFPAIAPQKRINKTLLDRMANQDQGAFKAMWATGIQIPVNPETNQPVEPFQRAIDRLFVNEDPNGKFGQFEAEDIKQLLEAVNEDVKHAAVLVPTPPDQLLGEMVNVSADGLKSAQASLITRVRRHMRSDEESLEEVGRLALRAAGKDSADSKAMTTIWRSPEFRTEGEMADAGLKALSAGVPEEAVWERYFGASPQEIKDWSEKLAERASSDPLVTMGRDLMNGTGNAPAGGQ